MNLDAVKPGLLRPLGSKEILPFMPPRFPEGSTPAEEREGRRGRKLAFREREELMEVLLRHPATSGPA